MKYFTRHISRGLPKLNKSPLIRYENAEESKSLIFKENTNKSFVYRWVNKINGKEYLGSTANAKKRLNTYFNKKTLQGVNMPVYKAILKYGHSNFIFEIIAFKSQLRSTPANYLLTNLCVITHIGLPFLGTAGRNYSTNSSFSPLKIYSNADIDKLQILKENKSKAGVYR